MSEAGPPGWGPPWRSDRGRRGPWGRRRWAEAGPGWGDRGPRPGFGCVFGLLFLLVAGSLVATVGFVASSLGPLPVSVALVALVVLLAVIGRGLGTLARTLDRLVAATRAVADGDLSVRVGPPGSPGPPSLRELTAGFDAMVERLEDAEAQRRELLADVSHELRTPLTVIAGSLEAIVDGVHPADEAHLAPILEETRVLERLIEDVRTVALADAGTLSLHPEPTDPDLLIGDVVAAFGPLSTAGDVTLSTAVADDLPIVSLDPVRIRQVLGNLVANALAHTPSGGRVTIGGRAFPDAIELTVADTGPGIDPALLPYVFERFVKGQSSRGSGLGLPIARALVAAHGGTIMVESTPGAGSLFRVRLPCVG